MAKKTGNYSEHAIAGQYLYITSHDKAGASRGGGEPFHIHGNSYRAKVEYGSVKFWMYLDGTLEYATNSHTLSVADFNVIQMFVKLNYIDMLATWEEFIGKLHIMGAPPSVYFTVVSGKLELKKSRSGVYKEKRNVKTKLSKKQDSGYTFHDVICTKLETANKAKLDFVVIVWNGTDLLEIVSVHYKKEVAQDKIKTLQYKVGNLRLVVRVNGKYKLV